MILRPGTEKDIPILESIASAAKAHWGYSAAQLHAWRDELSVPAELLPLRPVCVAMIADQPVGFVQVATDSEPWELEALWVHPEHMRLGAGAMLLAWAQAYAAEHGQPELAIDADPNAEGFYLACGARRVGSIPAPIDTDPARVRPQLRLLTRTASG